MSLDPSLWAGIHCWFDRKLAVRYWIMMCNQQPWKHVFTAMLTTEFIVQGFLVLHFLINVIHFNPIFVLPCRLWKRWRRRWRRDIEWSRLKTVHLTFMTSWCFAGRRSPKCDLHSISSKTVYRLSWTNTSLPQSPDIIFFVCTSVSS